MVEALEELGEVASKAGLKVTEVEEGLVALAADTLATLEVSEAGEVLYTFPDDVTGTLRNKSFRLRIEPVLQQALVFSFVFGDGNPNRSLDDARWSAVGQLIEDCGGVVTAEQAASLSSTPLMAQTLMALLAPFLDLETLPDTESSFPDEGFVVPVLQ
eukprot:gene32153-40670_t